MKNPGDKTKAKYWGTFTVEKVARLKEPVICYSEETGKAEFHSALIKIKWEKNPSEDKNELWFPYWMTLIGKYKYGQFAPMIGERPY
jgi:hypothetical protein